MAGFCVGHALLCSLRTPQKFDTCEAVFRKQRVPLKLVAVHTRPDEKKLWVFVRSPKRVNFKVDFLSLDHLLCHTAFFSLADDLVSPAQELNRVLYTSLRPNPRVWIQYV